jgi:ribosomal protein L18E
VKSQVLKYGDCGRLWQCLKNSSVKTGFLIRSLSFVQKKKNYSFWKQIIPRGNLNNQKMEINVSKNARLRRQTGIETLFRILA